MRSWVSVRWFVGILGIAAALLTSAPAHADRDCPNGQISSQDCTGDNCGSVQTRCARPTYPPAGPLPPWPQVYTGIVVGVGI
jgi:hypothetical protein